MRPIANNDQGQPKRGGDGGQVWGPTIAVEFAPLVIKAVGDLVPDNHADRAVIQGVDVGAAKHGVLHAQFIMTRGKGGVLPRLMVAETFSQTEARRGG